MYVSDTSPNLLRANRVVHAAPVRSVVVVADGREIVERHREDLPLGEEQEQTLQGFSAQAVQLKRGQ